MKAIILFFLSLTLGLSSLQAQVNCNYEYAQYILQLAYDNNGNLFVGHEFGIAEYDGTNWIEHVGLSQNNDQYIYGMASDNNGNIWAAMETNLLYYDGSTWTDRTYANYFGPAISKIDVDANNELWIVSGNNATGNGVIHYDGTTVNHYTSGNSTLPTNLVVDFTFDSQGRPWVITQDGVVSFNGGTWTLHTSFYGISRLTEPGIAADGNGNIFVIASNYLYTINEIGVRLDSIEINVFGGNTTVSFTDNAGNVWFRRAAAYADAYIPAGGSFQELARSRENMYGQTQPVNMNVAPLSAITQNPVTNQIALGAHYAVQLFDAGANYQDAIFPRNTIPFIINASWKWGGNFNTSDPSVTMYDEDNVFWHGGVYGLVKFDGNEYDLIAYPGLGPDRIFLDDIVPAMTIDAQQNLWIAHRELGILKYDRDTSWQIWDLTNSGLSNLSFWDIEVDLTGNVWVGAGNNTFMFDGSTWSFFNFESREFVVTATNELYSWNQNDIRLYDGVDFNAVADLQPIYGLIQKMFTGPGGKLWFSTRTAGILSYDGDSLTKHILIPEDTVVNSPTATYYDAHFDQAGVLWTERLFSPGGNFLGLLSWDGNSVVSYSDSFPCLNAIQNQYNAAFDIVITPFGEKHLYLADLNDPKIRLVLDDNGAPPYSVLDEQTSVVSGVVFWDKNQNGMQDAGEPALQNQIVERTPDLLYGTTNTQGRFFFAQPFNTNLSITYTPQLYWNLSTPSTISLNTGSSTVIDTLRFGVYPTANVTDLSAYLTTGLQRCGQNTTMWVTHQNVGTTVEDGTLSLKLDTAVTLVSAFPVPDNVLNDRFVWNLNAQNPGAGQQIRVFYNLPLPDSAQQVGDTLNYNVSYYSTTNADADSSNNEESINEILLCAYDPNDKLVDKGNSWPEGYTLLGERLTYTIRFQNTGNDTAFNVRIADTLDAYLNPLTFEVIGYSHPMQFDVSGTGTIEFSFPNIMLPDSNVDFTNSMGFVKYAISPRDSIAEGTEVRNTAHIYFDFNPAIVTNTTLNTYVSKLPEIVDPVSVKQIGQLNYKLYPNPTDAELFISLQDGQYTFQLYDLSGKMLKAESFTGTLKKLNVSELNSGMYFYKLTDHQGRTAQGSVVIK